MGQTASIPLSALPPGPASGTLANGVAFDVNIGTWHSVSPSNTQGYILYPSQTPQVWTFDVPVSLRFGLRGLNITGECFEVPAGTMLESLHPAHTWNAATRRVCRGPLDVPTAESTFVLPGPVTQLSLNALGTPQGGRGPGFIEVTVDAGIALDKTASGPIPLVAGSTISYDFLVTNTGGTVLTNVTVTDPLAGMSPISCPATTLTAGATMTCTATYVVTPADVNAGFITNTATATGTLPSGAAQVSDQDSTTIPPNQTRSISLQKSATPPDAAGLVSYTFGVTNTGTVTLNNVTITDPLPGLSAVGCPATSLTPGASMTCSATYTLTQTDIDSGFVSNTATVEGTPQTGAPVTDQASAVVNVSAGISLAKTGSGPDPLTAGSTIAYSFVVTNSGQLALTNVTVADPLPGLSAVACPGTSLAPGASMTCAATYTVTPADVTAGVVENTATAAGTPPNGLSPVSATSSASVPPAAAPDPAPPVAPVPTMPQATVVVVAILLAALAAWRLRGASRA